MSTVMPRIHLGQWADDFVNWLQDNCQGFFDGLASVINHPVNWITDGLLNVPVIGLVIAFAVIAWLARGWKTAVLAVVGFLLIDGFDQMKPTIQSLGQIVVASVIAIVIAIPLGVWTARSRRVSTTIRPVLDFMQTLPPYVYILPGLFLMGLGPANAVIATVVFALPPGVRLTELGIRQVDQEMVEAGQAFGATPREVLRGIQMPLALPNIMAGINQVIMLALSMIVIAGVVGSPGLGQQIFQALSQLDVGLGVEAGVSVVILAIFLDRVTDGLSKGNLGLVAELTKLRSRSRAKAAATSASLG
ncbi:MAG TPA: ABC transporter permease subunit [Flexivirga sp.]|uniref:ABC transporter permease n=1 Tax=Flexivirga sp. TaxID=1962927 RepID=UPI002BEF34F6|nr:ABC transporter permease subunit [Flexivirga sp.]HWC22620.1 ABC transporter permease subunit [Flexivirga sp.]